MASIILIGGGGHCESCIDVIEQQGKYNIAGIVDMPDKVGNKVAGYQIIADDSKIVELTSRYDFFLITMGQINSPVKRMELFKLLQKLKTQIPVIISPQAYVSRHAGIGQGTIIHHHAFVNIGAEIGENCIINSKALVEHNVIIDDNVHISTGAIINGGAKVGKGTFIGSGSIIRESVNIGEKCIIGSGIRVMHSVKAGEILKVSH
ncbi:MAG: acetyltransferase [Desulfobacula sp.]|nr:acetyltransferase [Desulfobacula sp.]